MKFFIKLSLLAALVATVVGANWALSTFGFISVGFGLSAPAGVLFAGLAFGLRDSLHEAGGRRWVFLAIGAGAALSLLVNPVFATASAAAFLLSETADFLVYSPLRNRNWVGAVVISNLVGSVLDSVVFLALAFGSLDFITGQVVGKAYMTILALPIVWLARRRASR